MIEFRAVYLFSLSSPEGGSNAATSCLKQQAKKNCQGKVRKKGVSIIILVFKRRKSPALDIDNLVSFVFFAN